MLSSFLHLDYGGSGQGFGGYALFSPEFKTDATGLWIWRCMEIAGVSEWTCLPGRTIRVRANHSSVEAIGHILKDLWFDPKKELAALNEPSPGVL